MGHNERIFRVLVIDDSEDESAILRQAMERMNLRVSFRLARNGLEIRTALKLQGWSLVISDFHLKEVSASTALEIVKEEVPELPFILFTENVGEESVADLMRAGVEDVVLKTRIERLFPVVRRIIKYHDTQAKEERAHRIANEAFAAKEQMLAIVSHDIKNPLCAIQLQAQMLVRASERSGKSELAEEVKIQALRILKTTDRMKTLISDLLDKNKSANGLAMLEKAMVSPFRLIQDVLESLRPLLQEKEIFVRISVSEESLISLDRNKMFQVFSNLINNAIKFTPAAGTILISMEETSHEAVFSVEDSGPGLTDQEIERVFEKYWTGSSAGGAGTGLGLFICKTVVEAHGGQISVENSGAGARFRFTVPKSPSVLSRLRTEGADLKEERRKKICVVDDDEDLREVMSWALGKEGYAVLSFGSPIEALEAIRQGSTLPDLLVVDYHMDGIEGDEFVRKKQELLTSEACPVIVVSASPQEVEKKIPREFYREVLTKPLDLESLVGHIRELI